MPKVPKISFHIFAISTLKHGDEVEFLDADKHKRFLQDRSITLGVISQARPKYQKQSFYNIFARSQGKMKDEVDFLPAHKC